MFEVVFFRTKEGKQQHQPEELPHVKGLEVGDSGCQSYIYVLVYISSRQC